jgi:hypothetical protein
MQPVAGRVFLFFSLAFLLTTSREPPWADAHVVYDTTENLVDNFQLDVRLTGGSPWFYAVRDGRRYGVFPLGNVIAMVPSYLVEKSLRWIPWLPSKPLSAFCAHISPALLMAGACALLFTLLRRRGMTPGWSFGGAAIFGFATLGFIYARVPYSEALQTIALLWLVERTFAQGESPTVAGLAWLGVSAGVLINSKLVYALVLPFVVAYLVAAWRRQGLLRRGLFSSLLGVFAFAQFVAVALWHNRIKTGSFWTSGYQIPEGIFSGDLGAGVYGFLFSTGKSVFLYAPPVIFGLLGLPRALRFRRADAMLIVAICVVCILFNAKFRHWHADYCWGPRHLVSLMPLVILLAFPWLPEFVSRGRTWLRRMVVSSIVAAGVVVQLLGASIYWDHYIRVLIAVKDQTGASGWFTENLSHGHYIPSFSPLAGQTWMLKHLVTLDPDLDRDAPWKSVIGAPADLTDAWNRLRVDWWPLEWADANGVPAPAGGVIFTFLAVGFGFSAVGLRRRIRSASSPTAQ